MFQKKSVPLIISVLSLSSLVFSLPVLSQTDETCPAQIDSVIYQAPPVFKESERDNINISADKTRSDAQGKSDFLGHVVIEKHELRITADEASYSPHDENIIIKGNVHVDTSNIAISADTGHISKEKKSTLFENVEFQISKDNMRGKAASITAEKETSTELKQTSITTCSLINPDWQLDAKKITLDHDEEYGSADNVVLRFMNVPFLYIPYMEFPIGDRRRSGLLAPEIGHSSSRGGELVVPWYWNIAPNHDAILAPHFMNRRGTQLDTQYRFLTEASHGQFNASYLNNDKQTQNERYQLQYQQYTRFSPDLNMDINIQDVSDTEYFNDFSNNLSLSSSTHLTRNLKLNFNEQHWHAHLLTQTFETLDTTILTTDRPYRRLPQIQLKGDQPITDNGLAFTLDSEWVYFDHEDDTVLTGSRLHLKPGLHWLTKGSFWFIDPAIKFSHTQYEVEDSNGVKQTLQDRNLPMSSLDAGLFFERTLDSGDIHTLEPRLYYLNVPYRDQSLLPNFDSLRSMFSTSLLFRDNHFNGGDRISDANQLTLAISTRLINSASGSEYLRASIGQIRYFKDQQVSLTGATNSDNKSDLIAEFSLNLNHWNLGASTQWNTDTNESERGNFSLHYQSDSKHIFNLGLYSDHTSAPEIRQTDVSFMMPINNEFSAFARWNYSLEQNRDIEVIGGLSYDACCWSVQLMGQRQLKYNNTIEEYDNAIVIQLVLKGLGSVSGNKVSETLDYAVLGYNEDY